MKHKTIRQHRHFITPRDAMKRRSECFFLKIKERSVPGETRYGLVASKKVFKTAVTRNRAKRVMRAWLTECEDSMNLEMDYIFILNPNILNYPKDLGLNDTRKALCKMTRDYYKENEKQSDK